MTNTQDQRYLNIRETAERLGVETETLILWNENNILKPTITLTGEVAYKEEQIKQFLDIQKRIDFSNYLGSGTKKQTFPFLMISVFVLSFSFTVVSSLFILNSLPESTGSQEIKTAAAPPPVTTRKTSSIASDLNELLGTESAKILPEPENIQNADNTTYSETVFDNNSNLKGDTTNTGVLASAINYNYNGLIPNSSQVKQNIDLNLLLAIFALGSISLAYYFKKQPAYSIKSQSKMPEIKATDTISVTEEQKVIAVSQKTDGTVVLCYQGQEYKVSKPELDSDSDQFIERLMELGIPGIKEIDYDANTDDRIKLTAPLSKIVTRLGFVGIKRDLFFPRTSKNRVLFRKYVTREDLAAMNLIPDQIKSIFVT